MCLEFLKDTKTSLAEMKGGNLCSIDFHLSSSDSRALKHLDKQTGLNPGDFILCGCVHFSEKFLIWTSWASAPPKLSTFPLNQTQIPVHSSFLLSINLHQEDSSEPLGSFPRWPERPLCVRSTRSCARITLLCNIILSKWTQQYIFVRSTQSSTHTCKMHT